MERAIQVQFLAFSTKHDLLSDYQSGSRKKHSTETALVYLTDYIVEHMDGQMITGAVFIELKKAFDLVCQDNPCFKTPFDRERIKGHQSLQTFPIEAINRGSG